MRDWDELHQLTERHMDDPQIGDYFHEHYNFWIKVTGRCEGRVQTSEGVAGLAMKLETYNSIEEFKKKFQYTTMSGYSIQFYDRPSANSGD